MKRAMLNVVRVAMFLMFVFFCSQLCLATTQFAITTTAGSLWGEYTSPYGTNNVSVGSIICDDFKDTVTIGSTHTYYQLSANSVIQGSYGIWGSSRLLYQAASYLAIQIFQESNSTLREYENWALWAVFDPTDALAEMNQNGVNQAGCEAIFGTGAWVSNKCTAGTGNGGYLANAKSSGPAAYSAGMFNNLMIYVPQNLALTGPCTTPGKCDSQEFFGMVQAPDGGSTLLYLTIVSGVCFGAIFLKNRSKDVSISAV